MMRILIVEDSTLVQKMYGMVFPKREHTLVTALNGRSALDIMDAEGPVYSVILLDLRMPDMNGVDFIAEIRKRGPEWTAIPIILTTAEPEESDLVRRARALGIANLVRKPWKPQELREAIRTVAPGALL
jgi:CheY-like chemotaxis protein